MRNPARNLLVGALLVGLAGPVGANGRFPQGRPASRADAVQQVRLETGSTRACLTPEVEAVRHARTDVSPATLRAISFLQRRFPGARDQLLDGPHGIELRYATPPFGLHRPHDADADGRPDAIGATLQALERAHDLLVGSLELPQPAGLDVLLVELGDGLDGYTVPSLERPGRIQLVLDATPRGGTAGARRAAIHQYAHAVALSTGNGLPGSWAEALAGWAVLAVEGISDDDVALFDRRLRTLGDGLAAEDADLAAGNALWLAFLDEAYGIAAVRFAVEELARDNSAVDLAFDRAIRRVSTDGFAEAFREFHVWSLLTGKRADDRHLSFAGRLAGPVFASSSDTLPALSVQADPAVRPLGATQVRLQPEPGAGGLRLDFEGDFSARWEVDLLLYGSSGSLHRLALPLTDGRVERTVPLNGLAEAVLLIRNLGSDDGSAQRYTYAARHERAFPFELAALEAARLGGEVLVRWETSSEDGLIGFNVERRREDGGQPVTINPVWIPALGGAERATAYSFLDTTAEAGADYVYTVQGITVDGLTSPSDPVSVARDDD